MTRKESPSPLVIIGLLLLAALALWLTRSLSPGVLRRDLDRVEERVRALEEEPR